MRFIVLFLILVLAGCGSSARTANPVTFQNSTTIAVDKKYAAHFEDRLRKTTTASVVVYRITALDEGSRAARMLFWFNAGTASAVIWSHGIDSHGSSLWERTERAECTWGFTGGSVDSCLDEIAARLP